MNLSKEQKIAVLTQSLKKQGFIVKEIIDNSLEHASHAHYSDSGSHFHAVIIKSFSSTKEKVQAQKLIMKSMIDFIPQQLHSLTLEFIES